MAEQLESLAGKTLAQLVKLGECYLGDISDSARLDAQVLLCFVLQKPYTYLLTWPDETLSAEQYGQYQQLLQRRKNSEPVAYLSGEKEFWSLMFEVSPATLIPRPDTETLIELVLDLITEVESDAKGIWANKQLLDLGTGTGAIALALASELPNWQVDAVDFNVDAVELAKRNAKRLGFAQVKIYQSDWFSNVAVDRTFDIIVSNPPYIDEHDEHLSKGDVQFEPKSALVAKQKGLADIINIATAAQTKLNANGYLFLEHGFEQGAEVRAILASLSYQNIMTSQDLSGNDRITWACLVPPNDNALNNG